MDTAHRTGTDCRDGWTFISIPAAPCTFRNFSSLLCHQFFNSKSRQKRNVSYRISLTLHQFLYHIINVFVTSFDVIVGIICTAFVRRPILLLRFTDYPKTQHTYNTYCKHTKMRRAFYLTYGMEIVFSIYASIHLCFE